MSGEERTIESKFNDFREPESEHAAVERKIHTITTKGQRLQAQPNFHTYGDLMGGGVYLDACEAVVEWWERVDIRLTA